MQKYMLKYVKKIPTVVVTIELDVYVGLYMWF